MSLFREEAIDHRKKRLHGNVSLALPVSWQAISLLLLIILIVALIFFSLASYSRIETVNGVLVPEKGLARVQTSRTGIIEKVHVKEGQFVRAGDKLLLVRRDEVLADGSASAIQILEGLRRQRAKLGNQEKQMVAAAHAEQAVLFARITGLQDEVGGLRDQITVQESLVKSAKNELEQAKTIAQQGFISRRDILLREETYLSRQQQLSQLRQTLARQLATIQETQRAVQQAQASMQSQIAALGAQQSDIEQKRIGTQSAESAQLNAPLTGKVTALTARAGQSVTPNQPLLMIVPHNSELLAELYVPSSAIGFLEAKQRVRLALDAFPYQRFGIVTGNVRTIATAPILQTNNDGKDVPVYIATVTVEHASISAFGKVQPLIPGMTLTARITTEEQSLLEWLFEPLFAVSRR